MMEGTAGSIIFNANRSSSIVVVVKVLLKAGHLGVSLPLISRLLKPLNPLKAMYEMMFSVLLSPINNLCQLYNM